MRAVHEPLTSALLLQLEMLWLDNNPLLGGTIPPSFTALTQLSAIELHGSAFDGTLPALDWASVPGTHLYAHAALPDRQRYSCYCACYCAARSLYPPKAHVSPPPAPPGSRLHDERVGVHVPTTSRGRDVWGDLSA